MCFWPGWNGKHCPHSTGMPATLPGHRKPTFFLACQYLSNEDADTHTMVATVSRRILPGKPRQCFSLALLILPLLEHGGYAITELTLPGETPRYSFVSAVDGVLVSDSVGKRRRGP